MRRLKVRFFDIDYVIKTDAEEDYVQKIASYLEDKVKEISKQENAIVVPRSFLLAMLKITDDYFKVERDFEEFKDRAEERSKRLVQILESSLKENESHSSGEGIRREELGREDLEDSFKHR
ncbi:MAG: cell division protein ZapA [Deltaproteobacteria bacterium]|nr:cell division protein ZapA [Deltaproteobacteria bacterium]